jgi:FkbM family methyltransferase
MVDALEIKLPNGTTCHLTSLGMRRAAKVLRWEIHQRQRYLHPGFELRPTDNVLDVGGNLGMFVLWAAPQVPQGRVVSIEPTPRAHSCLTLNIEKNCLANVTALRAAVGRDGGSMDMITFPGLEALSHAVNIRATVTARLLAKWPRWSERVTVPEISLGRIMDEQQLATVNYLKLDCEGAEFEIIRTTGAAYWQRIERIAIEYHDAGRDRTHVELLSILKSHGFTVKAQASMIERHLLKSGTIWARRH